MSTLSEFEVLMLSDIARSTVRQVAATLRHFGSPYLLVVEASNAAGPARIRGLVSHAQVERQLGVAMPMVQIATTFRQIREALA